MEARPEADVENTMITKMLNINLRIDYKNIKIISTRESGYLYCYKADIMPGTMLRIEPISRAPRVILTLIHNQEPISYRIGFLVRYESLKST